jgi:hypothetical protein
MDPGLPGSPQGSIRVGDTPLGRIVESNAQRYDCTAVDRPVEDSLHDLGAVSLPAGLWGRPTTELRTRRLIVRGIPPHKADESRVVLGHEWELMR